MPTIGQGLNIAGAALAQALMQRKARRDRENRIGDLIDALAPQAFPEQMPGYQETMDLASSLVAPAPMGVGAVGAMGNQMKVREGYEEMAGKQNKQRDVMRALLMSGSPQAEKLAYQMGGLGKKMLQGAERYMNLGGGKVLDMTSEKIMDFSDTPYADPDKRFKEIESGGKKIVLDFLPTIEGGGPTVAWQGDPEQDIVFKAVGAPGDNQQMMAFTKENGKIVGREALGEPYKAGRTIIEKEGAPLEGYNVFSKEMISQIEDDRAAVQRSQDIMDMWDPAYQTIWGKAVAGGAGLLDKLVPLSGEPKNQLQKFAMFQQAVNENMNLYIKMITGAQMSEAEAGRLSLAIANLTDSPAEFEAKLKRSISVLDRAQKRKQEVLEYYAGIKAEGERISIEKAKEYAEEAAKREIQLGMSGLGLNWGENSAVAKEYGRLKGTGYFGGKKSSGESTEVEGVGKFVRGEDGVWRLKE